MAEPTGKPNTSNDTVQGEGEAGDERADRVGLFLHLFLGNLLKMINAWVGIKVNKGCRHTTML